MWRAIFSEAVCVILEQLSRPTRYPPPLMPTLTNGVPQEEAERSFLAALRPTTLIRRFATTDEGANMSSTSARNRLPRPAGPRSAWRAALCASLPNPDRSRF
jgi:hypothetical protein